LAVVLDAFSRRAVGWALGRNRNLLCHWPLWKTRSTIASPALGLVHHSDRGTQYASNGLCEAAGKHRGRRQEVVLRQEHRAGEKVFVDSTGATVPIHNPESGQVWEAAIFVAVPGASNYAITPTPRRVDAGLGRLDRGAYATEVHSLAETQKLGSTEFPKRTDGNAGLARGPSTLWPDE
jgi:hypothetical protein